MRRRALPPIEDGDVEESPVNLTPLIDVVFVLLITFMLIAPILNVDHVDLAQGGILSKQEVAQTPLAITLCSDQSIWFQGMRVNLKELTSKLKAEKVRYPTQFPQLIADKNCHFGLYQDVKNVLEECGFQQMDVVLK
jgi:biopolymer transport protein ExbD